MVIEFRVKNFRSLRDEQVLSLVASKDKTLLDTNTLATGITAAPTVLRSAVIYGANASGKSNVIKAMQYMRGVVVNSAAVMQPGQTFNIQPFRLNSQSDSQPTEFEVTFLLAGVRYQYGFALNSKQIVSEHLLVYKAFKPQSWFERHLDDESGKDVYEFGSGLKGQKNVWEGATRSNSLFLSMAVQLNSEQLRPVFDWFNNQLVIVNEVSPLAPEFSVKSLQKPESRRAICDFLTAADVSIADIDVIKRKVPGHMISFEGGTSKPTVQTEEIQDDQPLFHHVTDHGKAVFDLADESSGTRNLLFLAGPVLDILKKDITLVVDELDTSLHPMLVRRLVQLFHQPESNPGGAQLIFTTHDASLLDAPDLLRRDQIWFTEKDRNQATSLISLSEFKPRKNEALERGYLQGRYGGVPFLTEPMVGLER